MTAHFLDCYFFYRARYWEYALQKRPVLSVMAWGIKIVLVLLILAQMIFALNMSASNLAAFRQLSSGKVFLSGLLLNLARNVYFPGRCHQDIKRGLYYLYPVSGYTLNGWRMLETSSSVIFLVSVNLLILPVLARGPAYGFALPMLALVLCLLSLFFSDVATVIFKNVWLFVALLVLFGAVYFLWPAAHTNYSNWLENLVLASPAAGVAVLLAVSILLYLLDSLLLTYTSIKHVPHE